MKTHQLQIVLALAASLTVSAQPPRPPGDRMPPPPPSPLIAVLDANHDRMVSAKEIEGAAASLAKLDTNGDGNLTEDELRPKPPEGKRQEGGPVGEKGEKPQRPPAVENPKRPGPPLIGALDTDHDGALSAAEIAAAPEALQVLDKDRDGTISPEELGPQGPPPRQGGPRGGPQGRPPGPPPGTGDREGSPE